MFKRSKSSKDMLVFLDIDGVLNTTNARFTKYEVRDENVRALGMLVDRLSKNGYVAKIILSSTWRLGYEKEPERCSPQVQKLASKLAQVGLAIYDKTPVYKDQFRNKEIQRYIREYELKDVEFTYLILDDDSSIFDGKVLKEMNFYKVSERSGLTTKDVETIVKRFK